VDKLPVSALGQYEVELCRYIDEKHPEFWEEIREKKSISDDLKKKLEKALKKFGKKFVPSED
jgi:F-type H+/Na+-transporting ATPase subunit alpha